MYIIYIICNKNQAGTFKGATSCRPLSYGACSFGEHSIPARQGCGLASSKWVCSVEGLKPTAPHPQT